MTFSGPPAAAAIGLALPRDPRDLALVLVLREVFVPDRGKASDRDLLIAKGQGPHVVKDPALLIVKDQDPIKAEDQ